MTTWNFSATALACLATISTLAAQNEATPARPQDPAKVSPAGSRVATSTLPDTDRILANCILVANNNEIALSEHALGKLTNPDAKQFAQMMVKDHGDFANKLQKFTGQTPGGNGTRGHTGETGEKPATGDKPATREPVDASGMRHPEGSLDHVALIQELGRKHLDSSKKMLDEKQGTEVDQCYIGMQIGAHACVLDELQVFANHASPELRALFTEAQTTVKAHLDRSKEIAKGMMGKATGAGR